MSYQINDEALEAMYETVREQHQGLTDDECAVLARELFLGNKVSASQAQREQDEQSWRCGYDYLTEGALGDF